MKTVYLYGALRARFGGPFRLQVSDGAEAIRALSCQLPGFRQVLESGHWRVARGRGKQRTYLSEQGLQLALGQASSLHILPPGRGRKNGGAGKVIAGVAMVALAFYTGGASLSGNAFTVGSFGVSASSLAVFGAAMAVSGVSQMLTQAPTASYDAGDSTDQRASFLFNGPVNVASQGVPVPIVYGEVITGSVVVSSGISSERVADG